MTIKNFFKLVVAILICHLAGIIGSLATAPSISTWYATLAKPVFSPPNWVFAPVWLTLYTLMGIALFLVWQKRKSPIARLGLWFFAAQLILNALWSILFFGLQNPLFAFINIIALVILIALTIIQFQKISKPAAWLLIPYFLWVAFATVLNFSLWWLN